jgi:hypothetical protein
MDGPHAWDQFTAAEQGLVSGKLAFENAETTHPEEMEAAFNRLLKRSGLDSVEAVDNVVAALRNLLDVTAAREGNRLWDALRSLDYLQVGKTSSGNPDYNIGYMLTVRDEPGAEFRNVLEQHGYVVNMRLGLFGFSVSEQTLIKWSAEEPHKVSARYVTSGAWLVVPHWTQEQHYPSNKFDLHFDPANSACTDCNGPSRLQAAKMHDTMHLPASETRRFLQQQKAQTGLKITTP